MSMNDFLRIFDNMDICCICPDFLEGKAACHWISKYHHGSWVSGSTDGGCISYSGAFPELYNLISGNVGTFFKFELNEN